mmetsp:Transcript_32279/g.53351  ORF Transcript_32279/g.53351 Transcript_32279/m.53351 type:complete len:374 (+) Transcript_32279:34-1155(+)
MRQEHPTRPAVLRALVAGAVSVIRPPQRFAVAASSGIVQQPGETVVPLTRCGGAFCTEFEVDLQPFRAVVDTGSPFLLVDGNCASRMWGCFSDSRWSISLGDRSEEGFGGQDVNVEWRRGLWRVGGQLSPGLSYSPVNFGVVYDSVGKGGTQAIYMGLAKDRQARVRPTLLEQTDIRSLSFDFIERSMTLARKPLLPRAVDAVPLLDLRPLGAPVGPYAFRVHALWVNGARLLLQRPCVAVIDTGTTGLVISESLYDSDELPLPGAAIREVQVEALTERGRITHLAASRRRPASKLAEDFPLICTSVPLPWFESGYSYYKGNSVTRRKQGKVDVVHEAPHVLFLGLAFLSSSRLTIDTDEARMVVESKSADST